MSVQAMVAVMNYSRQIWGEKLLLLLIANEANWPDALAEMSEADLAFASGRAPRQLRRYLRILEDEGELICHPRPGRKTLFEIPQLPGEPDRVAAQERQRERQKQSYDARLKRLREGREGRAHDTRLRDAPTSGARADAEPIPVMVRMHDIKKMAERKKQGDAGPGSSEATEATKE